MERVIFEFASHEDTYLIEFVLILQPDYTPYLFTINATFVPPKAKEFDMAVLTTAFLA